MHNDNAEPTPKSGPVLIRTLIQVCWLLWGVLVLVALYGLILVSTERTSSPKQVAALESSPCFSSCCSSPSAHEMLVIAARKQSTGEIITLLILFAYPLVNAHSPAQCKAPPDGKDRAGSDLRAYACDSALYLIEKNAKLDVVNANGLSVDYYLNDWKESVYGEHPAGWDSVRAAIARRRASPR